MPTYCGGRHEYGQNYLVDKRVLAKFSDLVADTRGPIIEIGPGRGAITRKLQKLHRPLTAVEIDPNLIELLRTTLSPDVDVVHADFLAWHLPRTPYTIVGNIPFHMTTATLRKILHAPGWTQGVLLVQWEVARRRAGVGGASMMTVQWWPWIDFRVEDRVPRSAFRPTPSVDGGLMVMTRRPQPLIDPSNRSAYRQFVHDVFTGRGRGVAEIIARLVDQRQQRAMKAWLVEVGIDPRLLPKDLSAQQWVALFDATQQNGWTSSSKRPSKRGKQ